MTTNSRHWIDERNQRDRLIKKIGEGVEVKRMTIDKGHRKGAEIHVLSSTGIITIFNERSGKMVTKLIARPGQIRRFYSKNENPPEEMITFARFYQHFEMNK